MAKHTNCKWCLVRVLSATRHRLAERDLAAAPERGIYSGRTRNCRRAKRNKFRAPIWRRRCRLVAAMALLGTLLLASVTSLLRAQTPASIEGTVTLPKLTALVPLPRYPNQVVQPDPPEPPTAVVYLEGQSPVAQTGAPPVRVMAQKNLQFVPALLPVRTGTAVEFPNQDDLYHNVFSYSKPKRFDLGRYRKEEKPAVQRFDKPGVVKLHCEIHEHMRGVILVLDTPYFQRTDTNGHYRLENLPAGAFTLKAWLNERTVLERPVELKPGQALRVDFPRGE